MKISCVDRLKRVPNTAKSLLPNYTFSAGLVRAPWPTQKDSESALLLATRLEDLGGPGPGARGPDPTQYNLLSTIILLNFTETTTYGQKFTQKTFHDEKERLHLRFVFFCFLGESIKGDPTRWFDETHTSRQAQAQAQSTQSFRDTNSRNYYYVVGKTKEKTFAGVLERKESDKEEEAAAVPHYMRQNTIHQSISRFFGCGFNNVIVQQTCSPSPTNTHTNKQYWWFRIYWTISPKKKTHTHTHRERERIHPIGIFFRKKNVLLTHLTSHPKKKEDSTSKHTARKKERKKNIVRCWPPQKGRNKNNDNKKKSKKLGRGIIPRYGGGDMANFRKY